jgi:hypothetical protein
VTINRAGIQDGEARDAEEVEEAEEAGEAKEVEEGEEVEEAEENNEGGRSVVRLPCPPCAPFVLSKIITLEPSTFERVSNCPMVQNWCRCEKTVPGPTSYPVILTSIG